MIREAIEKIEQMAAPTFHEVDGSVYSNQQMVLIQDRKPMPKCIDLTGLDSVCKMVRNEAEHVGLQIFIQVKDYRSVSVFTSLDADEDRLYLYRCAADTPSVTTGNFMPYEKAIIELRSLYIPNDGTAYLLNLLSTERLLSLSLQSYQMSCHVSLSFRQDSLYEHLLPLFL